MSREPVAVRIAIFSGRELSDHEWTEYFSYENPGGISLFRTPAKAKFFLLTYIAYASMDYV